MKFAYVVILDKDHGSLLGYFLNIETCMNEVKVWYLDEYDKPRYKYREEVIFKRIVEH